LLKAALSGSPLPETDWSRRGLHTGRTDAPLTAAGEREAIALRRRFGGRRFALVLSSPLSRWNVERGVALAKDVAMATNENRIALMGRLDFTNERFNDVTVAVVDGKGCVMMRQKIRGPFREPVVEKVNVLRSLAGPALKLFTQAKKLFGGRCEVFYAGSVAPPK
jgi:hypothetical protein